MSAALSTSSSPSLSSTPIESKNHRIHCSGACGESVANLDEAISKGWCLCEGDDCPDQCCLLCTKTYLGPNTKCYECDRDSDDDDVGYLARLNARMPVHQRALAERQRVAAEEKAKQAK